MQGIRVPDEAMFFIADGYYSIDQIVRVIYESPSERTRSHFLRVNEHLKTRVNPGQMVIVTPPEASSCAQWEVVMQEAARSVDIELAQLSEQERKAMARNYGLLSNVASYSAPMYGWTNNYFSQRAKLVKGILGKIDRLYSSTYVNHGHLKTDHFFAQRRLLFFQLDQAMNQMMKRELFGGDVSPSSLKKQLGISSKSAVHQWKESGMAHGVKGFENNYQQLMRTAKIFSRLGYVSIGLDVVGGVANIQKACAFEPESTQCMKARFTEPPKVTGSILGGVAGGGLATYGVCNLVFGIETLGTSIVWCGLVAGAAGGYAGSKAGGWGGEKLGNIVYEARAE